MTEPARDVKFFTVDTVAYKLGVPTKWLKDEARAGRVPVIRTGSRTLMDLDAVRQTLVRRSVETVKEQADDEQGGGL